MDENWGEDNNSPLRKQHLMNRFSTPAKKENHDWKKIKKACKQAR